MAKASLDLDDDELELLLAALDSHRYWELADPVYAADGAGAAGADAEAARALAVLDALEKRLVAARGDE